MNLKQLNKLFYDAVEIYHFGEFMEVSIGLVALARFEGSTKRHSARTYRSQVLLAIDHALRRGGAS